MTSIARAVVTDPRTMLPLLLETAIAIYYLVFNTDAVGGQFVAGYAVGLMFLVVVLGLDRARMARDARAQRDYVEQTTALAAQQ